MNKLLLLILIFALFIGTASAQSVFYPAHGNGAGTFNTYTGVICTNLGASSPCARYDEGDLHVDMDLDTVKYQVQNKQGTWRYIQYDIPNPTNLIPSPQNNPKSLVWMNMYANNTNLRYLMQSHGIKLDIWGNGTPPSNYFNFTYTLSAGVTYRMQGEEILFMDTVTGEPLWLVQYPSMKINGTDVPLTFKKDDNKISIHAPDLFTNPEYNFSAGWELDPSTQSGSTIYISDRHNLTEVNADIANASALQDLGSGEWLLNANLINNNTANTFFLNETDVTWLKINSTHTATENIVWYYLTNGKTEINNTKITSWNTTFNTVESLPVSTWTRSSVYSSGSNSKMNISNSNLSYLGYSSYPYNGVVYQVSSRDNIITDSVFMRNYWDIYLITATDNTITNTTFDTAFSYGLRMYASSRNIITNITLVNTSIFPSDNSNNNIFTTIRNGTGTTGYIVQTMSENNTFEDVILRAPAGINTIHFGSLSSNNTIKNSVVYNSGAYGISLATTGNNFIDNCTAYITSATGWAIYLVASKNNTIVGGYYQSPSSGAAYGVSSTSGVTSTNNTFNQTGVGKIRFGANDSYFNYTDDGTVWLESITVISPTAVITTTRTHLNWTQSNLSWTETLSTAAGIRYNTTGLLSNTQYQIWNGTSNDFNLTTDASGILPDFTINFTTTVRTVKVLQAEIGEDTTAPTYSGAAHNQTVAGLPTLFSIQYNDETALHPNGQWIFSTNNTGEWVNESAVNWTATPEWANVTKTLNSTVGTVVGYRWYANDSAGNSGDTPIYTLTVTSAEEAAIEPEQVQFIFI